jgi:hypothetical protein
MRNRDRVAIPVCVRVHPYAVLGVESGRLDLNQRPFGPQPNALPDCATPRVARSVDQSRRSGLATAR